MRSMDSACVDSIVTDPPYELTNKGRKTGFMELAWDGSGIAHSVALWSEAMRVLKPGGHLLAFGGARTHHRMVWAIENAGFEIRDQIMWIFGAGQPKNLDIGKAITKSRNRRSPSSVTGASRPQTSPDFPTPDPESDRWEGWGSALKPAHEPVCVARKPLGKGKTLTANVLRFSTGALNIDACRVPAPDAQTLEANWKNENLGSSSSARAGASTLGRWPANILVSYPEESYRLRDDVTPCQLMELAQWMQSDPSSKGA